MDENDWQARVSLRLTHFHGAPLDAAGGRPSPPQLHVALFQMYTGRLQVHGPSLVSVCTADRASGMESCRTGDPSDGQFHFQAVLADEETDAGVEDDDEEEEEEEREPGQAEEDGGPSSPAKTRGGVGPSTIRFLLTAREMTAPPRAERYVGFALSLTFRDPIRGLQKTVSVVRPFPAVFRVVRRAPAVVVLGRPESSSRTVRARRAEEEAALADRAVRAAAAARDPDASLARPSRSRLRRSGCPAPDGSEEEAGGEEEDARSVMHTLLGIARSSHMLLTAVVGTGAAGTSLASSREVAGPVAQFLGAVHTMAASADAMTPEERAEAIRQCALFLSPSQRLLLLDVASKL